MKIPIELVARILSVSPDVDDTWKAVAVDSGNDPGPVSKSILEIMNYTFTEWTQLNHQERYKLLMEHLETPKKYHSFYE